MILYSCAYIILKIYKRLDLLLYYIKHQLIINFNNKNEKLVNKRNLKFLKVKY